MNKALVGTNTLFDTDSLIDSLLYVKLIHTGKFRGSLLFFRSILCPQSSWSRGNTISYPSFLVLMWFASHHFLKMKMSERGSKRKVQITLLDIVIYK